MYRMKKGLAAFIAAFFFLGMGGKAQAVIGIPDDVPASTLLFPFFKVQKNRTSSDNQDTLLVVTNTAGASVLVHVTIWSISSLHIFDFTVPLSAHDVFSCSLYDLLIGSIGCTNTVTKSTISPAPSGVRDQLPPPSGVTGTDSTLIAGYVTADAVTTTTALFPGQSNYPFEYANVLVGHQYLVNLPAGSSSGVNATSIESVLQCRGHRAASDALALGVNAGGFYRTRCEEEQGAAFCFPQIVSQSFLVCSGASTLPYGDLTERIDGPNGDFAQTGTAGGFVPGSGQSTDSPLSLIVRYFSQKELNAKSQIWLWKDRRTPGNSVNIAVYDEEENVHSVTFGLPEEVNFAETASIITPGVSGGWFRVVFPCGQFGSCSYNYNSPPGGSSSSAARPPIQSVAYALQFADSTGAASNPDLRWDAIFPAHRQYTDYIGPQ